MYIAVEQGAGRMPRYIAVRGTSQLEGFHHHLADLLVGSNYSAALAGALITIFTYRWVWPAGMCHGQHVVLTAIPAVLFITE